MVQHLILQAAGQRDDAVFLGILGQILLTSLLMGLAGLHTLLVDLLFLSGEVLLYNALSLTALDFQLMTAQDILDGLCEVIDIQLGASHVCQLVADADT